MPNFKPKANKKFKINKKTTTTLDSKHHEKMCEFDRLEKKSIPMWKKERKNLLVAKSKSKDIEERLNIEDKIKVLNIKIKKNSHLRKKYLLQNSQYIFEYFEKKKELSEGISKKKILHSFFDKNEKKTTREKQDRNDIQKYLEGVDEKFININNYTLNHDICKCGGELVPVSYEGVLVCKFCFKQSPYLIEHEKPSYKEPPKEVCFYAYKRINHFREILAQFQAKETTQIPKEVLTNIKAQIKKERIQLSQITNKKAKDILKKLGYNKYYEHIPFIKDKLGIKPPIMSAELEERLCNLFTDIQGPYAKYCPDDRVNFLNYYYTVYKLCELLDQRQFLPFFPMLKDREKRIEQDEIWKKICGELDWEFIPTI